jgi:hypothetical protein
VKKPVPKKAPAAVLTTLYLPAKIKVGSVVDVTYEEKLNPTADIEFGTFSGIVKKLQFNAKKVPVKMVVHFVYMHPGAVESSEDGTIDLCTCRHEEYDVVVSKIVPSKLSVKVLHSPASARLRAPAKNAEGNEEEEDAPPPRVSYDF